MLRNIIRTRLQSVLQKRPSGSGGRWRKRALILAGVTVAFLFWVMLGCALFYGLRSRNQNPP